MKKTIFLVAIALALAHGTAKAQDSYGKCQVGFTCSANITAQATTGACGTTVGACVTLPTVQDTATVVIVIQNNPGTIQFESSADDMTTWQAISGTPTNSTTTVTSTTGNGQWRFPAAGVNAIRARCSTFSSGTGNVTIQGSRGSPSMGSAGGAGSGTVDSCATTGALAVYISAPSTEVGCGNADFTYSTDTLAAGSSSILDLSAATITNIIFNGTGFTNGHILTATVAAGKFTFADGGAVPTGTVTATGSPAQYDMPYWNSGTQLAKAASSASNGVYWPVWNVTGATQVAPVITISTGLPSGTCFGTVDTGSPSLCAAANLWTFNKPVSFASSQLNIVGTNSSAPSAPASGSTQLYTETTNGVASQDSSGNKKYLATVITCTNQVVSAFAATGAFTCHTVVGADLSNTLVVTGILDGVAPINVTTTTACTLGTSAANCGANSFSSGYTFNQEGTAATAVTYTLPATVTGKSYCVRNSIVSGTGAADTGVLTVYPPASSYVILNGTRNTIGGGGTHGVASGGAAGDSACFVAIDATDWEVYVNRGTWTAN